MIIPFQYSYNLRIITSKLLSIQTLRPFLLNQIFSYEICMFKTTTVPSQEEIAIDLRVNAAECYWRSSGDARASEEGSIAFAITLYLRNSDMGTLCYHFIWSFQYTSFYIQPTTIFEEHPPPKLIWLEGPTLVCWSFESDQCWGLINVPPFS